MSNSPLTNSCHYCQSTEEELRPYGPGGADVCFPCATSTPEREAAAHAAFDVLMGAVGTVSDGPTVIGLPQGPTTLQDAIRTLEGK